MLANLATLARALCGGFESSAAAPMEMVKSKELIATTTTTNWKLDTNQLARVPPKQNARKMRYSLAKVCKSVSWSRARALVCNHDREQES